ncbi:MAG TPA: hypothetical protein P5316_16420 [Phycisphaerae bacterium]|nr:hypothetical protein [Phycisphaerae bacterium]
MANAQGIRAGRAFVELFADDSKLVRGLRRAEKKLKAFGDSVRNFGLKLAGLGTAMLAPLVASAKLFSGYGDQVAKMAKRTGVSVETLSELQFVASQTGTEFESLEMGFRKMQRSIYDAERGLSTAVDALADLNLTAADFKGLSPEQQFKLLADRISQVEDPTRKAAIAMSLFGRTGTNLLPMFASGAKGIEILQAEARRLGLTMSAEDAKAAEDFTDALDRLWKVVKMGIFHVGAALAPVLQQVADTITNLGVRISAWVQQNQQVIVTVLKVVVGVIAVGVAIAVLGTIISALGTILGGLITVITTVVAVLQVLGAVIAFLVSPIGLVIAAVAALAGYLIYATGAGGKALAWLGGRFNVLKEDALSAYQGIADALAAGDIGLAVKVLWLTVKMEWTRGVNFLEKAWLNFRNFFIKIGYDAWHGLLAVAEIVWHALEVGWIETTAFFSKLWTGFTSFFAKTWENIKAGAQKAWNWIKSLFDDSVDLEAENKLVEEQKQAAIARIEDEQKRKTAQREAERESERRRAAAIHEATLGEIGRENMEKHRALDTEYAQRMAENEADLAKARQEWRDAIDEARKKREAKEAEGGPDGLEGPDDIINKARDALAGLGDIGDLVQQEAAKIGVKGTFNAAAVQGLAAGDAADRTAKASEETAKNTKKLVQAAQTGGLTFA